MRAVFSVDLNKEEFIRRKRVAESRARTVEFATAGIFFAGLIALSAFTTWQGRHRSHLPNWIFPCLLILLFVASIAVVPNIWNLKRRARRNGLICPSCHEALPGPIAQIAIASGNCAHCGETVFREKGTGAIQETIAHTSQEPAKALEPTGLECPGTKEEFQLRERAAQRNSRSPMLFALVLMSVLAITSGTILPKLKANHAMGRPYAMGVLLTFAGLYVAMFILAFRQKRRIREYGLVCPGCQGTLTGLASQLAKATGCCSHCGEHLFHDIPFRSGESLEKRKEFADWKRAVDRKCKSAFVILISVAILGSGTMVVASVLIPPRGEFHKVPLTDIKDGMIFAAIALMYATGIPTLLWMKRLRRKSGLACLSCHKPLTLVPAQIAVATGICSHCGGSIFVGEA